MSDDYGHPYDYLPELKVVETPFGNHLREFPNGFKVCLMDFPRPMWPQIELALRTGYAAAISKPQK